MTQDIAIVICSTHLIVRSHVDRIRPGLIPGTNRAFLGIHPCVPTIGAPRPIASTIIVVVISAMSSAMS